MRVGRKTYLFSDLLLLLGVLLLILRILLLVLGILRALLAAHPDGIDNKRE